MDKAECHVDRPTACEASGSGGTEGRAWARRGGRLAFTGYNPPPSSPKSHIETTLIPLSPCSLHSSPSCKIFVFLLVLICPSSPSPGLPQNPSHYLPPPRCVPTPFYKGFSISKTANFSLVCERRNILNSPQHLLFSPRLYDVTSLLVGDEGRGEMKLGRGGAMVVGGG